MQKLTVSSCFVLRESQRETSREREGVVEATSTRLSFLPLIYARNTRGGGGRTTTTTTTVAVLAHRNFSVSRCAKFASFKLPPTMAADPRRRNSVFGVTPCGQEEFQDISRDGSHYSLSTGILPSLGARSSRRVKLQRFIISPYNRSYR